MAKPKIRLLCVGGGLYLSDSQITQLPDNLTVGLDLCLNSTKIDDALITMLKSSKVVIADFTGQRQAVYYEAGYAMGMGIPVIWTCREDEVNKLSFDTRQYPHILWKDKDDLYQQLKARLCAQIL